MLNQTAVCPKCFSSVSAVYQEQPNTGVTFGLPTPEAFDDPTFEWGGCQVELPVADHYFCANCKVEIMTQNVIFV